MESSLKLTQEVTAANHSLTWFLFIIQMQNTAWMKIIKVQDQPSTTSECLKNVLGQHKTFLTTDLKGCLQFQQNWLAEKNLPGFKAETTNFILCQLDIFARSGAFHLKKSVTGWELSHWKQRHKHHKNGQGLKYLVARGKKQPAALWKNKRNFIPCTCLKHYGNVLQIIKCMESESRNANCQGAKLNLRLWFFLFWIVEREYNEYERLVYAVQLQRL